MTRAHEFGATLRHTRQLPRRRCKERVGHVGLDLLHFRRNQTLLMKRETMQRLEEQMTRSYALGCPGRLRPGGRVVRVKSDRKHTLHHRLKHRDQILRQTGHTESPCHDPHTLQLLDTVAQRVSCTQ